MRSQEDARTQADVLCARLGSDCAGEREADGDGDGDGDRSKTCVGSKESL